MSETSDNFKSIHISEKRAACMAKVYIVILNWNGLSDTLECLASVFQLDYLNFEAIVVDNGSSDESVETIRSKFPQVILIENRKNLGFTGGNNVGMRYAMKHGADYVWLLNNDTVVETDSLAKLVDEAEQHPQVGLVSPVIQHYDCPENVEFMGAYVDYANFKITVVTHSNELESQLVQHNLILWGTALLIKKEVIETVGYLSEKYFAYAEDCDYSIRSLRANYRTMIILDANILHKGARSTGYHSPIKIFLGMRNLYFLWSDNTHGFRRILVPGHYIGMVINCAKCLSDEGNKRGFDACLNGFWAAFREMGGGYDPTIIIPSWLRSVFCFFVTWQPYFWVKLLKLDFRGIVRATFVKVQAKFYKVKTKFVAGL
jgi:hypothetical protein